MSTAQSGILSRLFEARFLEEHWPDRVAWAHGSPARLPAYLRGEALRGFAGLAGRYRGRVVFGDAASGSTTATTTDVAPGLLRDMGLSLYLPDLGDCVPGTAEFLRAVERELGARPGVARIGAFAAAEHNGVTAHYDAEEVISVQLEGRKRFFVAPMTEIAWPYGMQFGPGYQPFDDIYPQMDAGIPKADKLDWTCVDMQPGSVLFMPRGTWHRTEADSASLSVSIIVRQPAAFEDVLEQLRTRLLRDPAWRRPGYGIAERDAAARDALAGLLAELPGIAAQLDPDGVAAAGLEEPERLAALQDDAWLQRIPGARLVLSPPLGGGPWRARVKVTAPDGREQEVVALEVPPAVQPVLQWLAGNDQPMRTADLARRFPNTPAAQLGSVCDLLVRAGFLKLLPHEPLRAAARVSR